MTTDTTTKLSPVHASILDWSERRPDWQRDALRRLIQKSELDSSDISELLRLCEQEAGLVETATESLAAVPLARCHLPTVAEAGKDVCLESISNAKHVNALADNQVLSFGHSGLTLIYGDNGSGKTGYSRILKRACRARISARNRDDRILANVYEDPPGQPAQAEITFLSGSTRETTTWADGSDSAPELTAVSFFDSDCATVHVQEPNDIAFTPFGLDLLERLASVCEQVQTRLSTEKKQLESDQPASLREPKCRPDTRVGKAVASLSRSTVFEKIAPLAVLTDAESDRIQQIRSDLASNPVKAADALKTRRQRIEGLRKTIIRAAQILSDSAVAEIRQLVDDAAAKQEAAELASTKLFENDPLPNVGNRTWKALWEAARAYSESEAYPDRAFPVTDNAHCVLCQQELTPEARDRMGRFDEFVKNNASQAARAARSATDVAIRLVKELNLTRTAYHATLEELKIDDESLAHAVRLAIIRLRKRQRHLLRANVDNNSCLWDSLPGVPESIDSKFTEMLEAIEAREQELRSSENPERRAAIQKVLAELEDRQWLSTVLEDVENEIFRLGQIRKVNAAIKSTRTTEITKQNKALADEHVTNKLRDRFIDEMQQLHADKVRVELVADGGSRGSSRYRIRFIRAPEAPVVDVLSEGENKCIALAAFLTELATCPSDSALLFDDPVSSLDHKWRTKVAERLAEEAKVRQVIVFTHDIVLLHDLMDMAEKNGIPVHHQRVLRTSSGAGTVRDELPDKAQKTKDRLDSHGKLARKARRLYENDDEEEADKLVIDCYSDLRATIELAIEQYVFCHVIVRYRDYVNTKDMNRVWVIEKDDCVFLKTLFDKCSDVTAAHSKSPGRNYTPPRPRELEQDIDDLTNWIEDIRTRRKANT